MRIDVMTPVLDIDGEPVRITEPLRDETGQIIRNERGEPKAKITVLSLRDVCENALQGVLAGDEKLSGKERVYLGELALRIHREDHPDLEADDVVAIKSRLERTGYGNLVVMRVFRLLEGRDQESG